MFLHALKKLMFVMNEYLVLPIVIIAIHASSFFFFQVLILVVLKEFLKLFEMKTKIVSSKHFLFVTIAKVYMKVIN